MQRSRIFIYLLERYADYKNQGADEVLRKWDAAGITQLIYDLYEIYHVERLENAFVDIDEILAERELESWEL